MTKKYIKIGVKIPLLIVLSTVLLIVVSIASFGEDKKKNNSNEKTPEYVYKAEFKELGNVGVSSISNACITDEGIYMVASYCEFNGDDNAETTVNYFIRCYDDDRIETIEMKDLKNDESVESFFLDKSGNMVMFTRVNNYDENTGEVKNDFYIINADRHGVLSKRTRLMPDLDKDEKFYPNMGSIAYRGDELITCSENKVYTFNKDGSEVKIIEIETYIDFMFVVNNDKVYVMSYLDDKSGIRELNMETGKLGEALDNTGNEIYNIERVRQIDNDNVYLSNSYGVFECNFRKNKIEFLFEWIDVDINNNSVLDFQPMEDGSIVVLCSNTNFVENEDGSSDVEIVTINKKKYSEVKQNKNLKFATYYLDEAIKAKLIEFNRTNDDYRIEVSNYGSYDASWKQLNLDIMSDNIPDIIEVSYIPKEIYIKKGLLADLYPIMEKDGELKKEDFVDSVRTTFEHNSSLYYMPIAFGINIMTGSKITFGDMEGWSYEEMQEKYNDMQKNDMFMSYVTSEGFIQDMFGMRADNFIDYETGEVNFDSEEFIQMLEFSKYFQTNYDYINSEESIEEIDFDKLTKENKLILREMYLYDFAQLKANEELYKELGGYTVLSYPSADKSNKLSMSSITGCFAISEKCDDKEGAWEFIKMLYEDEFQMSVTNNSKGFPVIKAVLDKKIEEAMEDKTDPDTESTYVESDITASYSFEGFLEDLGPYTKEHMEIFRSIVDRIGSCADNNIVFNDINDIIIEETKAFYAGEKTAAETAEILQSRVKKYISENNV